VGGNRSAFSGQQKTQIQALHKRFVERREVRSLAAQAHRDVLALNQELEEAFSSIEALNTFARNTLELRTNDFDVSQFSETDLQTLKNMVMGELAKARAKKYGWTGDPKSVAAWLRDKFLMFFTGIVAKFFSEKPFQSNDKTTAVVRNALEQFRRNAANPVARASLADIDPDDSDFSIVTVESSDVVPSQGSESQPQLEGTIPFDASGLSVIDTPRDGNCMLWSLAVGLKGLGNGAQWHPTSSLGADSDLRREVLEKDIPTWRQAISLGLRQEAATIRAKGGNEQKARDLEFRAQDIECSSGAPAVSGAIRIKPTEMRFAAQMLGQDIAIIESVGEGFCYYLCTKEGESLFTQSSFRGSGNFPEGTDKRFLAALQNGPAIFAEGVHARALVYRDPVGSLEPDLIDA
jgi:hypothetical protein